MAKVDLETRCKTAILKIADLVQDIDMKLCHLIKYGKKTCFHYNFKDIDNHCDIDQDYKLRK